MTGPGHPCKHAISCQYRACTGSIGPVQASTSMFLGNTGVIMCLWISHVHRVVHCIICIAFIIYIIRVYNPLRHFLALVTLNCSIEMYLYSIWKDECISVCLA